MAKVKLKVAYLEDKRRNEFVQIRLNKILGVQVNDCVSGRIVAYRHSFVDDSAELSRFQNLPEEISHSLTAEEKYNSLRNDSLLVELSCAEMGKDTFSRCETVLCFASFAGSSGLGLYLGAVDIIKKISYADFLSNEKTKSRLIRATDDVSALYKATEMFTVDDLGLSKRPRPDANFWETRINKGILSGFENRLVVSWRSRNPMRTTPGELDIFQIRPSGYVREFPGYSGIRVRHDELTEIIDNQEANSEWRDKLSAVAGIYLISHKDRPELYVGSACGENGVWGRWKSYSKNSTGGNKGLIVEHEADENFGKNCYWSMLQALPLNTPKAEVIKAESLWKAKLGTRARGQGFNFN